MPDNAFWKRSVTKGAIPDLGTIGPLFSAEDRVMSAGSCFASNMVPWLQSAGIEYVRTEPPHPAFAHLPENLGYRDFSAAYGNIYTVKQFVQLIHRATGEFFPVEDRWHESGGVIDPFRPGLRYPAENDREFDALRAQHYAAVLNAVQQATVLVFTLGLTEAWVSVDDDSVFPVAPGVIAGVFDSGKHVFRNFSFLDVVVDLEDMIQAVSTINPLLRIVLTVSPVPLVATATDKHVLLASTYSKAVLRAAAGFITDRFDSVEYFPAYEIITGPQANGAYFEADARSVTPEGIGLVMQALLGGAVGPSVDLRPEQSPELESQQTLAGRVSQAIVDAECEEALLDHEI
jgi:hypothetical protein